jgi:hypothetical protein
MHRREFIRTAAATALVASFGEKLAFAAGTGDIPYRILGHTGEKVSLLGIGGFPIGQPSVPEPIGIGIIRTALDSGVNFLVSVCITGCDSMDVLQQGLTVARNFKPLTSDEVAAILAKTETAAANGQFEGYKTTDRFNTTTRRPEFMG